jgi:hypothetical protein
MSSPEARAIPRTIVVTLGWLLALGAGLQTSSCGLTDRDPSSGDQDVGSLEPCGSQCAEVACPADDACKDYTTAVLAPGSVCSAANTCPTVADCAFTWKPEALDGAACSCDELGCKLDTDAACADGSGCEPAPACQDDEACGIIECPVDPCRAYDPPSVSTNLCVAGACLTPSEACTSFTPQRVDQECSPSALCDDQGNCARPKKAGLAPCGTGTECSSGSCVATAEGVSVCCAGACTANQVCSATGDCIVAPACESGNTQCSGSSFQRCVGGEWQTVTECGAAVCSVELGGCQPKAQGTACTSAAECASNSCVDGVCCNEACGDVCETCATTGICRATMTDTACPAVQCSQFDASCVRSTVNTTNACVARGQCRTENDCGFLQEGGICGDGVCSDRGLCVASVSCGSDECPIGTSVCCAVRFGDTPSVRCIQGSTCPAGPIAPDLVVACDEDSDCGGQTCCYSGTSTSYAIGCQTDCSTPDNPMFFEQIVCSSPGGFRDCPTGQACENAISDLPDYAFCRTTL